MLFATTSSWRPRTICRDSPTRSAFSIGVLPLARPWSRSPKRNRRSWCPPALPSCGPRPDHKAGGVPEKETNRYQWVDKKSPARARQKAPVLSTNPAIFSRWPPIGKGSVNHSHTSFPVTRRIVASAAFSWAGRLAEPSTRMRFEVRYGSEGEGSGAAPLVKPKLPLKLMAIIAAGGVLVAGLGVGAYFLIGSVRQSQAAPVPVKPAVFIDLPEVLVNLSNTGSDRTQYLKVKIVLELSDQLLAQQITPVMPRVMDTFQTYLRELRPTDLDGSAGLYRLKEELTRRVNVALAPNKVNAVLFKEIIVQ